MPVKFPLAMLLLAAALFPACSSQQPDANNEMASGFAPNPEEMRAALITLLHDRPDMAAIPEYQNSLDLEKPIIRNGLVHIGIWECNPKLLTFEALFSAPNITMCEVSGRFEIDARDIWVAIPRRFLVTHNEDIGEFWRPNEVDSR